MVSTNTRPLPSQPRLAHNSLYPIFLFHLSIVQNLSSPLSLDILSLIVYQSSTRELATFKARYHDFSTILHTVFRFGLRPWPPVSCHPNNLRISRTLEAYDERIPHSILIGVDSSRWGNIGYQKTSDLKYQV